MAGKDNITKKDKHADLLVKFEEIYKHLDGERVLDFQRGVNVGHRVKELTSKYIKSPFAFKEELAKEIDAVVVTESSTWILEVKPTLNYGAIGQVLVYRYFFEKGEHDLEDVPKEIKLGIVCETTDELLEDFCKENGIRLFRV